MISKLTGINVYCSVALLDGKNRKVRANEGINIQRRASLEYSRRQLRRDMRNICFIPRDCVGAIRDSFTIFSLFETALKPIHASDTGPARLDSGQPAQRLSLRHCGACHFDNSPIDEKMNNA